jgi:PAS domain S-box-containing protein
VKGERNLRLLIVEDSEDDCQLMLRELRRGGFHPDYLRVDTDAGFQAALAGGGWDIVLSDYSLPGYSGEAVIRTLRASGLDLPCIIVSGAIGEDAAVTAIRDGAHDYVMKDRLARLPLAVEQQLAEAAARRERRRMEEEVRRSNAELAALQAIALAVSRSLDLNKILEAALRETLLVLDAEAGAVFISGPLDAVRRPVAQRGFPEPVLDQLSKLVSEGLLCPALTGAQLLRLDEEPGETCARLAAEGWSRLLVVALQTRQEGDGLLLVGSRAKTVLAVATLPLAGGIGRQISVALENARLHEQVRERTRYLEILQAVNEKLRSTLPLREVLQVIAEGATRAANGVAALILVPVAGGGRLEIGAISGNPVVEAAQKLTGRSVRSYWIPIDSQHPAALAFREGRLREWSGNLEALTIGLEPGVRAELMPLIDAAIAARSGACLPLLAGEKTLGVLVFFSPRRSLSAQERLMLAGLADQGGRAVDSAKLFEETQRLRAFNESIVRGVAEAIFIQDDRGLLTFLNPAAESLLGYPAEELKGKRWSDLISASPNQEAEADAPQDLRRYEAELLDRRGEAIPVIVSARPLELEGHSAGILSACTDISDRVRAERLLQALNRAALAMARALTHEETFAAVARECSALGCPCLLLLLDAESQVLRVRYLSYAQEQQVQFTQLAGVRPTDLELPTDRVAREWGRLARGETLVIRDGANMLQAVVPSLGSRQAERMSRSLSLDSCIAAPLITDSSVMGVFAVASSSLRERDVPAIAALANQIAAAWHKNDLLLELRRNLLELKKVQSQLIHAQKMEAVGRLAGGVAHDFNNQLTVIIGNAERLLEKGAGDERLRQGIEEILNTAQRSTQLTRQLLTFSRKQVRQPVNLEARRLVQNMEQMLRRLIGEDIELAFRLEPDAGWIHADPGQLEQVIMNLAVNARDAMPRGGKLVILTCNADLAQSTPVGQAVIPAGRYVMLAVSDNGSGMDPLAMEHLFEPFFTTKPAGVGTGLGLAIVYGIVRQNGGSIAVESERDKGSTFTIYLPRIEAPQEQLQELKNIAIPRGRGEIILLAEDEAALARLLGQALKENGYEVLSSSSSDEAVRIAQERPLLHLLLTDVIMPGSIPRKEMDERLLALHPGLQIIHMSGYTDEAIAQQGVLRPGCRFLAKPFSITRLLQMVRGTLDEHQGSPSRP